MLGLVGEGLEEAVRVALAVQAHDERLERGGGDSERSLGGQRDDMRTDAGAHAPLGVEDEEAGDELDGDVVLEHVDDEDARGHGDQAAAPVQVLSCAR